MALAKDITSSKRSSKHECTVPLYRCHSNHASDHTENLWTRQVRTRKTLQSHRSSIDTSWRHPSSVVRRGDFSIRPYAVPVRVAFSLEPQRLVFI